MPDRGAVLLSASRHAPARLWCAPTYACPDTAVLPAWPDVRLDKELRDAKEMGKVIADAVLNQERYRKGCRFSLSFSAFMTGALTIRV